MLWLVLAALVLLAAAGRGRLNVPLGGLDLAVLGLIGWNTLAELAALGTGSPRPTVNMLWEWIGLGATFFSRGKSRRAADEARGAVAAMIALAVGLSVLGFYQTMVELPAERAELAHAPQELLERAGLRLAEGSAEKKHFDDRLASPEPLGTFALTNSLAGYLTPWLVLLAALALTTRSWRLGLLALPIGGCVLLTKSRSAYLAVAAALCGVAWSARSIGRAVPSGGRQPPDRPAPVAESALTARVLPRKLPYAAVLVALALLGAAAVAWDRDLLAQAGKSLGYRWQYWQATGQMIVAHPWLGCGAGNFQDEYTAYKLPEASEEIRDPHNFLLEIWATAGTPAAAAMLLVLGWFAVRILASRRSTSGYGLCASDDANHDAAASSTDPSKLPHQPPASSLKPVIAGAACGLVLAHILGILADMPLGLTRMAIVGIAGAVAFAALAHWLRNGPLQRRLDWTGGGGALRSPVGLRRDRLSGHRRIAVAAACFGNESERGPATCGRRSNPNGGRVGLATGEPVIGLVGVCVAAGICYLTGYGPVLRCRTALLKNEDAGDMPLAERRSLLLTAARADPLSGEPVWLLAGYELRLAAQSKSGAVPPICGGGQRAAPSAAALECRLAASRPMVSRSV